jgi:hypothetical protein
VGEGYKCEEVNPGWEKVTDMRRLNRVGVGYGREEVK